MSSRERHDDLRQVEGHEGWRGVYHETHASGGYQADESLVHYPQKEVQFGD